MLQYYATAATLKLFSVNQFSKSLYRSLGNIRNSSSSQIRIADKYYFRTPQFLDILRSHGILQPGLKVLEIGTGFIHWEALMLRNEIACDAVLYDVWDNRTFHRFQSYVRLLADPAVRALLGLTDASNGALMAELAELPSFEAVYRKLGFKYLIDPTGLLKGVDNGAFDLIVSSDVGEHLYRNDIATIMRRTMETLKPGGWAFHQVVLVDHLKVYAKSVHPKQYLEYSKSYYNQYLNTGVQYINQVQSPEWKAIFEDAGFEIVALERIGTSNLKEIQVHSDWALIPEEDLACTVVQFLLRKPLAA